MTISKSVHRNANHGSILRSDLDGKYMTTIIPPGGTFTPRQIRHYPGAASVYRWRNTRRRISRGNESLMRALPDDHYSTTDRGLPCGGVGDLGQCGKIRPPRVKTSE